MSSLEHLAARHKESYAEFSSLACLLESEGRFSDTYLDLLDRPPAPKTFGGTIAHVITHNMHHRMHHRAHLLLALGWLGIKDLPEGDILGWEMRVSGR